MANTSSPVDGRRHATLAVLRDIDVADEHRDALDEYLSVYIDPTTLDRPERCPDCGFGMFTWSDAWGAGYCHNCRWPGRLYHAVVDRREDAGIVCHATCNGYRVCEATRGEHEPREHRWYGLESKESRIEVELHCPNPTTPPGLNRSHFDSRFKPPEVARFNLLLWAHPDFVTRSADE